MNRCSGALRNPNGIMEGNEDQRLLWVEAREMTLSGYHGFLGTVGLA